ncbi:Uncharacterised protein [Mycolicibacterium vanbaalenii]|uniref:Uncharacterized protein n=1 Tax=Mycolicibacterium vanbaalenii TaxID=110539 RepID=A0A5S9PX00_MYCVN|nr:Uncharacterised protein [Mycolicibacterium vanbaalenii]
MTLRICDLGEQFGAGVGICDITTDHLDTDAVTQFIGEVAPMPEEAPVTTAVDDGEGGGSGMPRT